MAGQWPEQRRNGAFRGRPGGARRGLSPSGRGDYMKARCRADAMDLLSAFRTFLRVAEAGSFSAVARRMNTTQPAISRQIAGLEEHLGARLIQRTTRTLMLTEDGRNLLSHAREVLEAVDLTEAAFGRQRQSPSGVVRLSTPVNFGRLYVVPRLGRLLGRYPDLSVELLPSDGHSDLVAEGLDLAIRIGEVNDAGLVARRVGSARKVVVASAEYVARHGEPAIPQDLAGRDCVILLSSASPFEWHFESPEGDVTVRVNGRFRTTSGEAAREAVLAGLGYGLLSTWFFGEHLTSNRLRLVLKGWQSPPVGIHAVYPSRRNLAPRTRAVIDFLVDEFRLDPVISSYGET